MHDHVHAILRFNDDADLPGVLQTWKSMSAHYLRNCHVGGDTLGTWKSPLSPLFQRGGPLSELFQSPLS